MSRPNLAKQKTVRFTEPQDAFLEKAANVKPKMKPAEIIRIGTMLYCEQRLGKAQP